MRKRGQLSIVLVTAAVIMIVLLISFIVYRSIREADAKAATEKAAKLSLQADEMRNFMQSCLKKTSYDGLKKIGGQSGYIDIPSSFLHQGKSYWNFNYANVQPFLNHTQKELLGYILHEFPLCVDKTLIETQGFQVDKGVMEASIDFANEDVFISVSYPITLKQTDFEVSYDKFNERLKVPYRRIFEAASNVNQHVLSPDFNVLDPLLDVEDYGFELSVVESSQDNFIFGVTDEKAITPDDVPYTLSFAAKLGNTFLKKTTNLQNHSDVNSAFSSFEVRSPDNKVVLEISEGTTANLYGNDVDKIDVYQTYPDEVFAENVPISKRNADVLQRQDLSYVITNPVYTFEPDGLKFNKPQRLIINYDPNEISQMAILEGKDDFWFPLRSFDNPQDHEVSAVIEGFSEFSAVSCSEQTQKTVDVEHSLEPSALCYVSLGLTIISVGSLIYFDGPLFTQLLEGGLEGAGTAIGEAIGTTFSNPALIGGIYLGLTGLSLGLGVLSLGAPTLFYEESPENCQNYISTCNQDVNVEKEENDGTGKCTPEGSRSVAAGQAGTVCAQVEKCNFIQGFLCMPCDVKCTATYI
ncbi:hypothetical protein ISS07_00110 [Candidatus Woesearchaeota archaeon]|nr:hypothetical protein [Candidatus Woesearchaeota archaeon]